MPPTIQLAFLLLPAAVLALLRIYAEEVFALPPTVPYVSDVCSDHLVYRVFGLYGCHIKIDQDDSGAVALWLVYITLTCTPAPGPQDTFRNISPVIETLPSSPRPSKQVYALRERLTFPESLSHV